MVGLAQCQRNEVPAMGLLRVAMKEDQGLASFCSRGRFPVQIVEFHPLYCYLFVQGLHLPLERHPHSRRCLEQRQPLGLCCHIPASCQLILRIINRVSSWVVTCSMEGHAPDFGLTRLVTHLTISRAKVALGAIRCHQELRGNA